MYEKFKLELYSIARNCEVNREDQDLPSHAWLRSSLSSLLQHHMAYKCTVPKYGTLIYRYRGDLVHALTVALGQGNHTNTPFGGSVRLKILLNRLGVCVSSETHARYVQYRVEIRQREGPLSGHKLDCPVIVSADNLDYQQSYSRVYSGNQSIGWHAWNNCTNHSIKFPTTHTNGVKCRHTSGYTLQ